MSLKLPLPPDAGEGRGEGVARDFRGLNLMQRCRSFRCPRVHLLALAICLIAPACSRALAEQRNCAINSSAPIVGTADPDDIQPPDPDPVRENFGARVAPYGGFLRLADESFPTGYVEKSHHYTKREYLLSLTRTIDGKSFGFEITESDITHFFEPNVPPIKEFEYFGCHGLIYSYNDHLTGGPELVLYWMHAPKQRLSIFLEQLPSGEWQPDDLIRFLEAMIPATGKPAFVKSNK